ncbi:MAG TPA: hypothetical protein VF598_07715, partial [Hymenobacter sp.]
MITALSIVAVIAFAMLLVYLADKIPTGGPPSSPYGAALIKKVARMQAEDEAERNAMPKVGDKVVYPSNCTDKDGNPYPYWVVQIVHREDFQLGIGTPDGRAAGYVDCKHVT